MKITEDVRKYAAALSAPSEAGGSGSPRSGETKGAAGQRPADASNKGNPSPLKGGTTGGSLSTLADAERGMAEMSEKFRATGGELYISETGEKRGAID